MTKSCWKSIKIKAKKATDLIVQGFFIVALEATIVIATILITSKLLQIAGVEKKLTDQIALTICAALVIASILFMIYNHTVNKSPDNDVYWEDTPIQKILLDTIKNTIIPNNNIQ